MKLCHWLFAVLVLTLGNPSFAQYADWKHGGSLFILTTPEGADLPASASLENFPLLMRLQNNGQPAGSDAISRSPRSDLGSDPLSSPALDR